MRTRNGLWYFAFVLFVLSSNVLAYAGTGKCPDTFKTAGCNSSNTCGSSSSPCIIQISAVNPQNPSGNASAVGLSRAGTALPAPAPGGVCVNQDAAIKWQTPPGITNTTLDVGFGDNPFQGHPPSSHINGGTAPGHSSPTPEQAIDLNDGVCFKFTAKYCKDAKCTTTTDPIVIIGNPN